MEMFFDILSIIISGIVCGFGLYYSSWITVLIGTVFAAGFGVKVYDKLSKILND